ncbi:MAG: GGDEF domain-containing protein [Bacteroidales bacterium]|nr:GGDEF domain-containing protein [Bacteroidales bacterium]MCM1414929.1 GGDEF domain-containing protein [bacterium]MCM1423077.1 GGDEF domain-containing protein [bacterium]
MKENSIFSTIYENICRDTGNQNESPTLIAVVRLFTITMMIHSLVFCILVSFTGHMASLILASLSLVLFLAVFVLSYQCSTFAAYCVLNVCILIFATVNVFFLGWNIGIQHFLAVLLVFVFFSKYKHEKAKLAFAGFLFVLRLFLFYYCRSNAPLITLDADLTGIMQIVNSFFIFLSFGLIAHLFSSSTQEIEGKLIEYNEKLMKQANTDTLTGLYNRRRTMEYLEKLLKTTNTQISICLCDIDFFKRVNDTYGHDVGDEVLKKISEAFQKNLPSDTFISRWGGEEFLLIFPRLNGDEAIIALETLRQRIREIVFDGGTESFSVSLTYGLVEYDYCSDITTLLKEADEKLYLGKESGRDRIVF